MERTVKSSVIIIPDENTLNVNHYFAEVSNQTRHGLRIKEFSEMYHLGLDFKKIGLEEGNYNGYVWSIAMMSLGHMCLQIDEDTVIYLPLIISDNQKKWFDSNFEKVINDRTRVQCISLRQSENDYVLKEFSSLSSGIKNIEMIKQEISMKYILSKLKKRKTDSEDILKEIQPKKA